MNFSTVAAAVRLLLTRTLYWFVLCLSFCCRFLFVLCSCCREKSERGKSRVRSFICTFARGRIHLNHRLLYSCGIILAKMYFLDLLPGILLFCYGRIYFTIDRGRACEFFLFLCARAYTRICECLLFWWIFDVIHFVSASDEWTTNKCAHRISFACTINFDMKITCTRGTSHPIFIFFLSIPVSTHS